jgi:hypothetical protein
MVKPSIREGNQQCRRHHISMSPDFSRRGRNAYCSPVANCFDKGFRRLAVWTRHRRPVNIRGQPLFDPPAIPKNSKELSNGCRLEPLIAAYSRRQDPQPVFSSVKGCVN